ncbi:hypothetical protein L484_000542 [Morus notabilis]|uniref:Retrotransposon gag domain-containing protein n=1 Tax=Morus notabilis TaxID=981085 RepID=W9SE99_9ROSA|nr:hypothetical protein L484_000542 [Morus notabilis]
MAKNGGGSSKGPVAESGEAEALWNAIGDMEQRIEIKFDKFLQEMPEALSNSRPTDIEGSGETRCQRQDREFSGTPPRHHHHRHCPQFPLQSEDSESERFKLRIDIPEFDGYLDIERFLDWVKTVDNFIDYMDIPKKEQNCAQGSRSTGEYTEEFLRLSARNNLHESSLQQVARFI